MKCSIHSARELIPKKTKYGIRYSCPVGGCTVVQWDGSTSTPADFTTRQTRIAAHEVFDTIWKSGILTRTEAYKKLAAYLGITIKATHIGHFNQAQCNQTIEFSEQITGF